MLRDFIGFVLLLIFTGVLVLIASPILTFFSLLNRTKLPRDTRCTDPHCPRHVTPDERRRTR